MSQLWSINGTPARPVTRSPLQKRLFTVVILTLAVELILGVKFGRAQGAPNSKSRPGTKAAQSPSKKNKQVQDQEKSPYYKFWDESSFTTHAAGAMVAGARDPMLILSLRAAGKINLVWGLEVQETVALAPSLRSLVLQHMKNDDATLNLLYKEYDSLDADERKEMLTFSQALVYAARLQRVAFAKSAKAKKAVTWGTIRANPQKYQGLVLPIEGRLTRLVQKEAPPPAEQQIVPIYYEGWVYTGFEKTNPIYVAFADLPEGVKTGENINYLIQFNGYFLKRFPYFSDQGTKDALLFVAPNFTVYSAPQPKDGKFAPELNAGWLKFVQDDKAFPDIRHKAPSEVTREERFEIKAYNEALLAVAKSPPEVFKNSSKEFDWVTWGHLFMEPWKFRGEVIPVTGRLRRLRRLETPVEATKQGIDHCYEGWVYVDTPGSRPVCVIFAHLPKGVEVGEKIDYKVRFHGYFFKRYRYLSGKGWQRTLHFFAPTFTVLSKSERSSFGDMPRTVVMGIFVLGAATVGLLLGLGWWFRRSDARVKARLAAARQMLIESEQDPDLEQAAFVPEGSNESNSYAFRLVDESGASDGDYENTSGQ